MALKACPFVRSSTSVNVVRNGVKVSFGLSKPTPRLSWLGIRFTEARRNLPGSRSVSPCSIMSIVCFLVLSAARTVLSCTRSPKTKEGTI